MYSDEDLNEAVNKGIFSPAAVNEFRQQFAQARNIHQVDEENFRLLSGFNDVFVVIASGLLLASLTWLGFETKPVLGALILAAGSWGLAEVFVRRKRMALPAIGLLLSFLAGLFAVPITLFDVSHSVHELQFVAAGLLTVAGAWLHWQRFRVPVTVAAAMVSLFLGVFGVLFSQFPEIRFYYQPYLAGAGLITFALAMYWDAKDPKRQTRNSDIAFWLHLLSAPLIVHPIFSTLGIFSGVTGYSTAMIVLALYTLLALVSIIVDRRAIMVSALVYVVYAMSGLLENYGFVSYSMALTGIFIGGSLLLLSAYWRQSRSFLVNNLPGKAQTFLPATH
ncbi:hypothetical protein [Planctobacterium marinum]|uniref:DUF2157 domain-containing protein n=1 Tax=Planctobacterium marinum TaxID=1631968 RepID=A0AA48KQM2_9ALTE|nr:hypothetical protein MACH26_34420 [Planctobacterium marinum]